MPRRCSGSSATLSKIGNRGYRVPAGIPVFAMPSSRDSGLTMRFDGLVLQEQRHLKWRALDPLENLLMILCGIAITGFCLLVLGDIVTRAIGRPWLWVQEATMTFFIYGIFFGVAAATRRNDHLYLAALAESLTGNRRLFFEIFNRFVVLCVALCLIYFGYLNFLDGFKSLRMPSMTPLASLYAAIPLCGALVALFTIEQMVNGWRNGFPDIPADERRTSL
jgi:TRAP-type C4-dicarboxylate transport system permease small subunit